MVRTMMPAPVPKPDKMISAHIRFGTDRTTSAMRENSMSIHPPKIVAARPVTTPMPKARIVASIARPMEMRPPYRMRENISRPIWSSPSQCSAEGGSQRLPIGRFGSCGASHGAKIAPPAQATMMRIPMSAVKLILAPNSFIAASPRMPEARIAEDRQHVRDHIEADENDGEDETAGLHHRHVALGDGIHHQPAEPVVGEDRLHHHD